MNAPNLTGYSQIENKVIRKHVQNQSVDHILNTFSNPINS